MHQASPDPPLGPHHFPAATILFAEMRTYLEKGLKDQTRWFILAWSALLIPIIGLWMKR